MTSTVAELKLIIEEAAARRIFPGAAVFLARGERVIAHEVFGTTAYEIAYSQQVMKNTLYDWASITKLFTATAYLMAAREAGVGVDTTLGHFFPVFNRADKRDIQIRHLLQHISGIEFAIQSLAEEPTGYWMRQISEEPLHAPPGERVLYSCTNFFLLARVIEEISGAPLDEFLEKRILIPLKMSRTSFYPKPHGWGTQTAPSEIIGDRLLHAVVHDEAARAWLEGTGHASCGNSGLFGTSQDLAKFCRLWLEDGCVGGQRLLASEDIENALGDTVEETSPAAKRGWGWQIDARFYMSEQAPPNSFGHAGFTGPTLWMNRATQDICIILNNRTYPTRNGPERFPTHRKIARLLWEN